MENKRIDWIDTVKGLGIFLVVLGHNRAPEYIIKFIYSFHMPLFFYLSGYLANPDKYNSTIKFLKSKISKLIVPYFIFNVVTYLYWIYIDKPLRTYENVIVPLKGMLYGIGTGNWLLHNNALWFLVCLSVIELMFYIITRVSKNYRVIMIILLISALVGSYIPRLNNPRLPWSVDTAFTGLVFYGIGYLLKNSNNIDLKLTNITLTIVALTYTLIFSFFNNGTKFVVDMNSATYGNISFFYLAAFSGILFIILIAKKMSSSETLKYLGKNSLLIFGLHILSIKIFKNQLGIGLNVSLIESLICTVGEIALLIPVIYAIEKLKCIAFSKSTNEKYSL